MKFKPIYDGKKSSEDGAGLPIINSEGSAGIVTLWSHPDQYKSKLMSKCPWIFESDSELVTLTSLYGNGIPQMLSNLAYNPQITRIAVTGADTKVVPSSEYLINFLRGNIRLENHGGVAMNRIEGSQYIMDAQLSPDMFKHLEVKRFGPSDLEGVAEYVSGSRQGNFGEEDRVRVILAEPKFTDFPSDLSGHSIVAKSPLEAWREVLWHLDRFGKNVTLKKGVRRALYNLDVCVTDASFEKESVLKKWGFDADALRAYQKDILDGVLPEDSNYSYGNRLDGYFGGDLLEKAVELLSKDSFDRHAFASLWDSKRDLLERKSAPCFTDSYFVKDVTDDSLMMTVGFRTHNAASAWLNNMYGLRAIQEKVAEGTGMKPGKINLRSRWIGIDSSDPKITGVLAKVKDERNIPIDVNDPKGFYTVETESNRIVVNHFSPSAVKLEKIVGESAEDVKNKLRQLNGFSNSDHAMWVGMQLADAERKLKK